MTNHKFDDIAPLYDSEVKQTIQDLLPDPLFQHAVNYIIPDLSWDEFSKTMSEYTTKEEFQTDMTSPVIQMIGHQTTDGVSGEGWENISRTEQHLFLSNHRDIILDAGFLNGLRHNEGLATTEIAIGDNLLIYPWIDKLVRLNKSFVVKRSVSMRQMLLVSKHLSEYIHYTIKEKGESIWMAQREGRAKDSDDKTQESLLKMIALYPEDKSLIESLKELNIIPLTISYEYDSCDYLKAKEFQEKRDNPEHKKTQRDDLLNMEKGLLGYKGRVVFKFAKCINPALDLLPHCDKQTQVGLVAKCIDDVIHSNYTIFPCNYIAYDLLNKEDRFADKYTKEDILRFEEYLSKQIEKIELADLDHLFLRNKMLYMYSNTLVNLLSTKTL